MCYPRVKVPRTRWNIAAISSASAGPPRGQAGVCVCALRESTTSPGRCRSRRRPRVFTQKCQPVRIVRARVRRTVRPRPRGRPRVKNGGTADVGARERADRVLSARGSPADPRVRARSADEKGNRVPVRTTRAADTRRERDGDLGRTSRGQETAAVLFRRHRRQRALGARGSMPVRTPLLPENDASRRGFRDRRRR